MTGFWTVMTIRGSKSHSNGSFLTETDSEETIRGSEELFQAFRENNRGFERIVEGPGE